MPPEYYFGIVIAIIMIILVGLLLKPALGKRRVVRRESSDTDRLANQLSRIADALEAIVVQLRASPPAAEPQPAPLQKLSEQTTSGPSPSETAGTDQAEGNESKKHHYVNLSMFGR